MDIGLAILIGIAVLLIMIYLSTRSIVEALNHWGAANESYQLKISGHLSSVYVSFPVAIL